MRYFTGIRLLLFLGGFVLFYDELWMFGIPLGRILPDMSDFHIEGFHHWMFGLLLMLLIGMSYIFPTLNQSTDKNLDNQVRGKQKGFFVSSFLFIVLFLLLVSRTQSIPINIFWGGIFLLLIGGCLVIICSGRS